MPTTPVDYIKQQAKDNEGRLTHTLKDCLVCPNLLLNSGRIGKCRVLTALRFDCPVYAMLKKRNKEK